MNINNQDLRLSSIIDFSTTAKNHLTVDVSSMPSKNISENLMQCFYKRYRTIGGESLPKDVVNMAIQRAQLPHTIQANGSVMRSIFFDIAEQFEAMNIHSSREVWRLTCIVTQSEYNFTISYFSWYSQKILRALTKSA